jgi:hypothetical protein
MYQPFFTKGVFVGSILLNYLSRCTQSETLFSAPGLRTVFSRLLRTDAKEDLATSRGLGDAIFGLCYALDLLQINHKVIVYGISSKSKPVAWGVWSSPGRRRKSPIILRPNIQKEPTINRTHKYKL